MMEIPLKGNLNDWSIPKILIYLNRNRKTGTLIVTTPTFTKKVYFDKGDAIFASSTFQDDRLGELLIKAGKITEEQYEESIELIKKQTGKRQGAILVELGYLTPKDLFGGVKHQVKEIVCSLFLLEDAKYEFVEAEIPTNEVITLKMSVGNLIYEGVKRMYNLTRINKEMSDMTVVLKLSADPVSLFQDIELTPQDKDILSMIDGKKTIQELLEGSSIGHFETQKTLYALWSAGTLEEKERAVEKAEEIVSVEDILQPLPEEQEESLKRVDEIYANLDRLSANELLEIDENSDAETVKKNYYRLAKEFHPDRYFSSADPSLKDKLTKIFDAMTHAYTLLEDDEAIKKYFDSLGKVKKVEDVTAQDAEVQFKRGVKEYKKGDYWGAADLFKWAIKLDPENAKYWSYLSLTLTKMPHRLKDSEEALLQAVKLEPLNAEHYVNLGQIYFLAGMKKRAYSQFEKALKLDPENVRAKKGLDQTKA